MRQFDVDVQRGRLHGFFDQIKTELDAGRLRLYHGKTPKFTMKFEKGQALGLVDGNVVFRILSLNVGGKYVGTAIDDQDDYDCMVVDECLVNPAKNERELPGLLAKYDTIAQSIFRLRDFRAIFLGNPYTTASS